MNKFYVAHHTSRTIQFKSLKRKKIENKIVIKYYIYIYKDEVKEGNIHDGFMFTKREEYESKLSELLAKNNYYLAHDL